MKDRNEYEPLDLNKLWDLVIDGFSDMWPSRMTIDGVRLGDVWSSDSFTDKKINSQISTDDLLPFHKLSQWLTYSLLEPIELILGVKVRNTELLTGLPEYRNGKAFIYYDDHFHCFAI